MLERRSNDEWLRDPKRKNLKGILMDLKKLPLAMESSVSSATKVGAMAGPDRRKNIEKSQGAKVVADEEDRKIKVGAMVKLLYPDSPIYGIVVNYEDDYHVLVHWVDGYIFPVHTEDLEVVSAP